MVIPITVTGASKEAYQFYKQVNLSILKIVIFNSLLCDLMIIFNFAFVILILRRIRHGAISKATLK